MRTVGIRELKNRLSEYLREVRQGEDLLVTDRGQVIAEVRRPGQTSQGSGHPLLDELARKGVVRLGGPNDPALYPSLGRVMRRKEVAKLLEEERGDR